jgi:rhamnulokinase
MNSQYLAVDLGATSGRVMLGTLRDGVAALDEVHRFPTRSMRLPDGLHWDLGQLFFEITAGMTAAVDRVGSLASVGFDTWGVDYALLSAGGTILGAPFHHRDSRTAGRAAQMDAALLFRETGIQPLDINTLMQLASEPADGAISVASDLLFMPDLLAYLFSGIRASERTIASTSQLLHWSGVPSVAVGERAGIPNLLPRQVTAGTVLGEPLDHVRSATGFDGAVIAVAGHDTASAVAAMPMEPGSAFISCGTWGLVGFELAAPILTDHAMLAGFTNEHGVDGTYRFLRNSSGLWLLTESLRAWGEPVTSESSARLVDAAAAVPRYRSIVDPLDPSFVAPGDMPARLANYCERTGQPVPCSPAEVARCILDSLALGFADAIEAGAALSGARPTAVHIVGGGSQIAQLCQAIADVTGLRVIAGPSEATALGNVLLQARALGELDSLDEVRAVVARTTRPVEYLPDTGGAGGDARGRFAELVRSSSGVL